jgi:uncharacterized protein (DUF1501 family)
MQRRDFIKNFTLLSTSLSVPSFLVKGLRAAQDKGPARAGLDSGRILVIVELAGGCDGLNTIVPFNNDSYYSHRPELAIPAAQVLPLDAYLGLHPSMIGLKALFDDGKLAVVQGVGYPNPNRSHFRSRDIWQTAEPEEIGSDGWLARYFTHYPNGTSFQGMNVGGRVPKAMVSKEGPSPSIQSLDTYQVITDRRENYQSTIEYPSTVFAQNLKTIAQIIAAELGVVVFYASLGGFDTHAAQVSGTSSVDGHHALLLETLSSALTAFLDDLQEMGRDQDTLIMTFSEFGRRLAENGSLGTDHGTANQIFMLGSPVSPGLYGTYPGLSEAELDPIGDLVYTVDFRSIYSEVLASWLGVDPAPVLGGSFPHLGILASL